MDATIYLSVAIFLIVIIVIIGLLLNSKNKGKNVENNGEEVQVPQRNVRPAAVRKGGARRRMGGATRHREQRDDSSEGEYDDIVLPDGKEKIGVKKMKKLQDKEDRRRQREADLEEREDRKLREEERFRRMREEEEAEELEEAKREAEEQKKKEEQAKREHEEYLAMKSTFSVEEEGHEDVDHNLDNVSLLAQFVSYVKEMKVVMMEDLAAHFNIKTQDCIDRIHSLQDDGTLSGVIDDRGKFIYITREEMEAVAKFIKQRGRVSITELAASSNKLINLMPDNQETMTKLLSTAS